MGKARDYSGASGAVEEFRKAVKLASGYFLLSLYLAPLAAGDGLARVLRPLHKLATALIHEASEQETEPGNEEREKLVIPSTVLHEAFRMLMEHGMRGREWVVALGYQEIEGRYIVTHVYNLNCSVSRAAEAEPDYGDLATALRFYERCGAQIAGLAHIHPWNARSAAPSAVDITTHSRWEEFYDGKFIGIVFTNSGAFRIFYTRKCRFRISIEGEGIRKLGDNLYVIESFF